MKKVKTVIISLLIAFASSFVTACSCTTGGSDGPVDQVLETAIAIECTSSNVDVTKVEESGYLKIECLIGDKFTINYTLSPDNATTTRVNWDYVGSDDILSCDRNTYSQTVSEPVTFVAKNVGYTTIQFESDATKKTTQAEVIVRDLPQNVNTFASVDGFSYNKDTAELSWKPVSKETLPDGSVVSCSQAGGSVVGLTGYEVHITDLTNDVDLETVITADPKITLDRGIEYAVSVIAKGMRGVKNDSPMSSQFKFCQLEKVIELKNYNGTISYVAPKFSAKNTIYLDSKLTTSIDRALDCSNNSLRDEFLLNEFSSLNEYKISVVSYPKNYLDTAGYSEGGNGIKYYPSVSSDTIEVKRIKNPEIAISNVQGDVTIGEGEDAHTFKGINAYLKTLISWNSILTGYDVKFGYAVYNGNTKVFPSNNDEYVLVDEGQFDASTLWKSNVVGNCTIKVYAFSDPETTIPSEVCSKAFTSLAPLDSTTKIDGNILTPSNAKGNIYGLELYFVNTSNKSSSKYFYKSAEVNKSYPLSQMGEIDLTQVGLSAGSYDVYARHVGIPSSTGFTNLSTTSNYVKVSVTQVNVCDNVKNLHVSHDGILKFANVSGIENYTINITQTNEDGSTGRYNIDVTKLGSSETSSYDAPKYSYNSDDGYNYISIYDVIGNALLPTVTANDEDSRNQILLEKIQGFTRFDKSLKFTVTSNKVGSISSTASGSVEMQRLENIPTVALDNYVLSFDTLGKNVRYVVSIGGNSATISDVSSGKVNINLSNTGVTTGDTSKTLRDLINSTGSTEIKIYALGSGAAKGSFGSFNSVETSCTFAATSTPTELGVDDAGFLTFKTNADSALMDRTFTITILGTDGTKRIETVTLQKVTPPAAGGGEGSEGSGEESEGGEPESQSESASEFDYFSINILDYIIGGDENPSGGTYPSFIDKIAGITIYETNSKQFTGEESTPFYVYMMPKLDINKVLSAEGNNPAIKFSGITNITGAGYTLTISSDNFSSPRVYSDKTPDTDILLSDILKQLNSDEILVGDYKITILPTYTNVTNSGISTTSPFVFAGESNEITITVKSKEIAVSPSGKNITWTAIENATYKFSYLKDGESTWSTPVEIGDVTEYSVYSVFTAGKYNVKIDPSIDYVNTGVYLVGNAKTDNVINKLKQPTDLKTNNGDLQFYTYNEGVALNVVLTIGGATLLPEEFVPTCKDYKEGDTYLYTIWTITDIAASYTGENVITVAVTSAGYIDSTVSGEYTAIRLTPPIVGEENFTKVGDKIYWSPVTNANKYIITFTGTEEIPYTLLIEGGEYKIWGQIENGTDGEGKPIMQEGWLPANGVFGIESSGDYTGRLFFVFSESTIVNKVAGVYTVTIQSLTTTSGHINSAKSAPYTITKLESIVTVSPSSDNTSGLVISGYDNHGNADPEYVTYTIERYTVQEPVEEEPTDPEGGEPAGQTEGEGEGEGETSTEPIITVVESYTISEAIAFAEVKDLLSGEGATGWFIDFDKIVDKDGNIIFAEEGTYRIFITFLGNNNNILTSEVFKADGIIKVPTTTLRTSEGVLTWGSENDATAGVSSYSLLISDGVSGDVQIDGITADSTTNLATLTDEVLTESGFTFALNTLYTVKVRGNGSGKISSNWSTGFKVMKLMAPTTLTVSTTSGGKPILTWADENNTNIKSNYIFAYDENEENYTTIHNTDGVDSELIGKELSSDLPVGAYTLRLKTVGNSTIGSDSIGLLSSDFTDDSSSVVVNYIANQSKPGVTNGGLAWDPITNENGENCVVKYKVTISRPGNGDIVKYTTNPTYSFLNSDITLTGSYNITVDAITDPSKAIISTHADTEMANTTSLYSANMLTDLMVKDGNLSWSMSIADISAFVDANKAKIAEHAGATLKVTASSKTTDVTNAVIKYVMDTVNGGNVEGNEELIDFLSFMYSFNMNINGVDTTVYADTAAAVIVTTNTVNGAKVREYEPLQSNYYNAQKLMFTYVPKLTAEVATEDGSEYTGNDTDPGKYSIKVAGKGNSDRVYASGDDVAPAAESKRITTIAVTSSRYTDELSVYKPNTPKTWSVDSEESEEGGEPSAQDESGDGAGDGEGADTPTEEPTKTAPRGIVEGNILWGLVTTDNSYITEDGEGNLVGNYEFHNNYDIIAIPVENPNSLGIKVKVDTDDTYNESTSTNTNLYSGNRYYKHIKSLFTTEEGDNHIAPNTNYNVTINVSGTIDSSLLMEEKAAYEEEKKQLEEELLLLEDGTQAAQDLKDQIAEIEEILNTKFKYYLNSDKYLYGNVMNILENVGTGVRNSTYNWSNSNGSTATKVVIYGPFDYAPIDQEDLDAANEGIVNEEDKKTRDDLLKSWKESITTTTWNKLFDSNYTAGEGDPRRIEKIFYNDASASGQNSLTISKEIENYIDESLDFGAGGYIIRKQEIGDRRGVVDTEFEEELFVNGEPEYGTIVNKLDKVTKVGTSWLGQVQFNANNETTATQGMFVWNKVPRANAYQVVLQEINNGNINRETDTLLIRDDGSRDIMTYDLPDHSFNDSNCTYRIKIVAVRVGEDGQLVDDYFSSDPVVTDEFKRADVPTGLKITGDGEISWTADASSNVHSYLIRVNDNYDKNYMIEFAGYVDSNDTILLNIGDMKEDATYRISIKVAASVGFINSSYTHYIEITKLGSPNAQIKDGEFTWGPSGVDIAGGNPTETNFVLSGTQSKEEVLSADITTYPLYTEITSYDQEYELAKETYGAGNYTFSVQFKGSTGDVVAGESYYIVSKATNYAATKLTAPVLEEADNTDGENKIKWKAIENATGYKVFVISSDNESYSEIISLSDTKNMLTVDGEDVTLSLTNFLNREVTYKFIDRLTTGVKVYIQAIGTVAGTAEDAGTQHVNSSYSDYNLYKTPNPAIDGSYDSSKGIISWVLEEEDKKDMDIFLTTTYNVTGVSVDEYTNYWLKAIGSNNAILNALGISTRAVSATSRQTTINEEEVTVHDLKVIDTIYLHKNGTVTPTSYQLTNYGTNYKIDVVVMSEYSSQAYSFGYGTDNPVVINFELFSGGDGTANLPYKIETESALNAIRDFSSSHFELVNDITLSNTKQIQISLTYSIPTTWDIVEEFSGVIDGKKDDNTNYTIKNVRTPNGLSKNYLAMFAKNNGTIKNLNIELVTNVTSYAANLQAAGVAITNNGVIDNVKVEGHIIAITSVGRVDVGGIAVYNNGTINNSTFAIPSTITPGLEHEGLYAYTSAANSSAIVGGIAVYSGTRSEEKSTISNSHFNGSISGNMIGGIAYENLGDIDKCYATGNAYLVSSTNNSIEYGGLVGRIFGNSNITNSYSQLVVEANVNSSTYGSIGGLVGNYDVNSITSDKATISGCYAVLDVTFTNATNSSVVVYAIMPGNSNITYENNVSHSLVTFTLNDDGISSGATIVTSISALNAVLSNVKDGSDNAVYNIDNTNTNYPTFA